MNVCKGVCERWKGEFLRPAPHIHNQHYALGQKRCQVCCIFLEWDGLRCPCCNAMLRCRPHSFGRQRIIQLEKLEALR